MDYFELLVKELEKSISIETDKMLVATKKLKESTDKLEELKKQKETILALSNKVSNPYWFMLNLTPFIVSENNVFYFDAEEYNSKSDIPIEEFDLIRFQYEDKKYFAKVVSINGKKNDFFMLDILKEE